MVAGTAMAVVMAGAPVPAGAAPATDGANAQAPPAQAEHRPAIADFEGGRINLANGWGDATACLVWGQGGILECFRSAQALAARESELSPERAGGSGPTGTAPTGTAPTGTATTGTAPAAVSASSSFSCSSSLRLFDYNYYGGRELDFWDRGYWQNLGDFGFDNQTSSYIVGGCYAHLAEYNDGAGWWYPGATSPYHGEPYMSSGWNDRVSSIYIE